MTQRTLNLTQNNNLPKRCPSKGSFRFNQFRYKKTRKADYEFGQNNTWKQILRGKLSRHKVSQGETQVFRTITKLSKLLTLFLQNSGSEKSRLIWQGLI